MIVYAQLFVPGWCRSNWKPSRLLPKLVQNLGYSIILIWCPQTTNVIRARLFLPTLFSIFTIMRANWVNSVQFMSSTSQSKFSCSCSTVLNWKLNTFNSFQKSKFPYSLVRTHVLLITLQSLTAESKQFWAQVAAVSVTRWFRWNPDTEASFTHYREMFDVH